MKLGDIASVVRSKNAGPFLLTFDVLLPDAETFERLRAGGRLTPETVAQAYGVSPNEILEFDYYPFAGAVKFSLRRPVPSGAHNDTDVYGAQQHVPLMEIEID
ncbi:acyl-CoA synthetase [Jannaschia sp. EhC01]|nr:acyl-CoA synthetase [Jannaschia sp. EhC01]